MSEIWNTRRIELVGRIAEMGPTFAARADGVDRDASFPRENYADLRDAGFLGLIFGWIDSGLDVIVITAERLERAALETARRNEHTVRGREPPSQLGACDGSLAATVACTRWNR